MMIRLCSFTSIIALCGLYQICITSLILIRLPASLGADAAEYTNCSSTIQCGTLTNIGYPFWGVNRPDYCGLSSEFELTCVDNTSLQITISNLIYRVLRVDDSSRLFTAARADYNNTFCPTYPYNTSQGNIAPFSFSSDTLASNLTLYYGCDASSTYQSAISALQLNYFECTVNDSSQRGYFFTRRLDNITFPTVITVADITSYIGQCKTSVALPANQSAVQAIEGSTSTQTATTALKAALDQGFGLQWANDNVTGLCQSCTASGGVCGRNIQNLSVFACYCSDKAYSSTCGGSNRIRSLAVVIGVVVAVGAAAVLILVVFFNRKSSLNIKVCDHVNGENRADVEAFIAVHGSLAPKRYRYWEVKKMTNSFSEKLGKGGYGVVYKGQLGEYGRNVAVKVLTESKGNIEDFLNEVASISRTAHVNVITLLGFCYEGKKRALIYEFMFNGSLDKFIRNREASDASGPFLEWNILYRIAIGIARGLEYLHQGCSTRILHFDIKPQNILLDENFSPKISDFGLAKLCKQRESIVSMLEMRGTVGYIAPEVFSRNFGGVSHKSDVYSYGMLVLDMVGGRNKSNSQVSQSSESYFPDSIFKHIEEVEGIRALGTTSEEEEEAVRKMVLVGLWCIQIHPSCRPSMKEVIEMLEGSSHNLEVPPKPYLSSPVRSPKNSSFTSSDFISRSLNVEISPILQES